MLVLKLVTPGSKSVSLRHCDCRDCQLINGDGRIEVRTLPCCKLHSRRTRHRSQQTRRAPTHNIRTPRTAAHGTLAQGGGTRVPHSRWE